MISCAYALLILNQVNSNNQQTHHTTDAPKRTVPGLGRLVFLGDGSKSPFYGAYELPYHGQFPQADPDLKMVTTKGTKPREGNNLVAYCSPTLTPKEIIKTLVDDRTLILRTPNPKLEPAIDSEQKCWDRIKKDWDKRADESSSNQEVLAQDEICSSSDIISLAHQGFVTVTGYYETFAPDNGEEVPKVNVRQELSLHKMVSELQTLGKWKIRDREMKLVWYFGHLHVFALDPGYQSWWPVTKIDTNDNNGAVILKYMREKMKLFGKLDEQLQKSKRIPGGCYNCLPKTTSKLQVYENKINKILVEIGHLTLGIPPILLNPSTPPAALKHQEKHKEKQRGYDY